MYYFRYDYFQLKIKDKTKIPSSTTISTLRIWHEPDISKRQIKWKIVSNFVAFLEKLNFTKDKQNSVHPKCVFGLCGSYKKCKEARLATKGLPFLETSVVVHFNFSPKEPKIKIWVCNCFVVTNKWAGNISEKAETIWQNFQVDLTFTM